MDSRSIGPYRLGERLGSGGMGEVFLAHDTLLDRPVAIKRLLPEADADPERRERFRREARAVARLNHPAIVQIYGIVSHEESEWIVMEYVEGRTLRSWLAPGPLPVGRAVPLLLQIAEGLSEAHAKGLVHRDLKSENVIVTPEGRAKILDFGLAKQLAPRQPEASLTGRHAVLGTFRTMAPEQVRGADVSPRSDLFALGVLVYETLGGVTPFAGTNPIEIAHRICHEPHLPLREIRPEIPAPLAQLVDRLLEKDPDARPQSAREIARSLGEIARFFDDMPTVGSAELAPHPIVEALLATDLVRSGPDRTDDCALLLRELSQSLGGRELSPGRLLFERPLDAVRCALAYHQGLGERARAENVELAGRAAIHLGEVIEASTAGMDPPLAVSTAAETTVARLLELAGPHQTLLTRGAFDLARGAASEGPGQLELQWLAHGPYFFADDDEAIEVCEVGVTGQAPLRAPADSPAVRRAVGRSEEQVFGWRPAPGLEIPRRQAWHLRRKLGEGGFGEVWLAAHQKTGEERVFKFCFSADRLRGLRREVLLFRVLRDALGHRDDIARILHWNFDDPPFSVEWEYAGGGDLVEWAESQGGIAAVALATRLELVAQVAEALAAAHGVGVLHKDVKPANILIATGGDEQPRAVLTDFGIGLLTDRGRLEASGLDAAGLTEVMITDPGAATAGTRLYAAPELMEGKPATVQADVYALGVLLYQVVAGDLSRALAPGWRRHVDDEILREDIARLVDGSPERRPRSASEVAELLRSVDERRRRRQAEAEAREAARRARRRRRIAAISGAVAVVFLGIVSVLAVRATRAREEADLRRRQAETMMSFLLGDLREKLAPIGRLDILADVGDQAMAYFDALPDEDLSDEELFRLAETHRQIGEVRMKRGDYDGALDAFEESRRRAGELVRRDPGNARWQLGLGHSHFAVGELWWMRRDYEAALAEFEAYRAIVESLQAAEPESRAWREELSQAHNNVGLALNKLDRLDEALAALRPALALKESLSASAPGDLGLRRSLAAGHNAVASVLEAAGEPRQALEHYRRDLAIQQQLVAADPAHSGWRYRLGKCHNFVGQVLEDLDDPGDAAEHYRRALELTRELVEQDPTNRDWQRSLAVNHTGLGRCLAADGRPGAARPHLEAALAVLEAPERDEPADPVWVHSRARARQALAGAQAAGGDLGSALVETRAAVVLLEDALEDRPDDPGLRASLGSSLLLLGRVWRDLGQEEKARDAWRRSAAALEPQARSSRDRRLLAPYAEALASLGRREEAEPILEELERQGYRRLGLEASKTRKDT